MGLGSLNFEAKKSKKGKVSQPWEDWLNEVFVSCVRCTGRSLLPVCWSLQKPAAEAASSSASSDSSSSAASTSESSSSSDSAIHTNKVVVTEIRGFAGQAVEVKRVLVKGSEEEKKWKESRKGKDGLDDLLAMIKPKNEMNTIEISKRKWEVNKDTEGDAHELEQRAKDG